MTFSSFQTSAFVLVVWTALWAVSSVQSFRLISTGLTRQPSSPTFGTSLVADTNPNYVPQFHPQQAASTLTARPTTTPLTVLFGKKSARKAAGGGGKKGGGSSSKPRGQQQKQEKQSVQEARFDANTRQFMFTMVGLTKMLPDKSKNILKNIHLSFYPGAKIGVVGLNGSVRA